jgi:hypothetical protein
MAELEPLEAAARTLEAYANRMREAVQPAETLIENKANNTIYTISELLDELAIALRRLRCIGETAGAEGGAVKTICTSWRIIPSSDGGLTLIRVKPETVVSLRDGRVFFHRGIVRMEVEGTRVKMCKWGYCKEFNTTNRDEMIPELPQILYILRHVANAIRKSAEAVLVCARNKAPSCVRL